MNKSELCEAIGIKLNMNKGEIERILDTFQDVVTTTLKTGQEVTLTGFGTFSPKHRSARGGVNPRNPSERIQVPAVTIPKFKAGKALKDALKHS